MGDEEAVNGEFREAIAVYKSRKQIEQLLEHNWGATDVLDMEGVNQLFFPKFSFEPILSDTFAPLHFYSGVKIADLIELDVALERVWASLSEVDKFVLLEDF